MKNSTATNIIQWPSDKVESTHNDDHLNDIATLSKCQLRKKYPQEYNSHRGMKRRCKEGKGVLHPAFEDASNFLKIMGPKPAPSYSLDRIDHNNPEYSPSNCRWASKQLQTENKSNAVYLTDSSGTTHSLSEWSRRTGTKIGTMHSRRSKGWPDREVIHGRSAYGSSNSNSLPAKIRREWNGLVKDPVRAEDGFQKSRRNFNHRGAWLYGEYLLQRDWCKAAILRVYDPNKPDEESIPQDLNNHYDSLDAGYREVIRRLIAKYGEELASRIMYGVNLETSINRSLPSSW